MRFSERQILIAAGVVALVAALFFLVYFNLRSSSEPPQVKLLMWGMEDEAVIQPMVASYHTLRPNVEIKYEKVDADNYEEAVVNALAAGRGPDVFMIGNRSLPKERDKLVPAGTDQLGLAQLRALFPQVVEEDFTDSGQVYALPLSVDTLALFWNRDAFDAAGVVSPPRTWNEFQSIVPTLREVSPSGQVLRAAAAIGATDRSVNSGTDLVELLMLQNGADMTDNARSRATFGRGDRSVFAKRAFNFYLQFANAASLLYTWNDAQTPALESFASGKAAMMFGYQADAASLKDKSPFLNFGIAPTPQPVGAPRPMDAARYAGLAVSKQSRVPTWGWDFVVAAATRSDLVKPYLKATRRPPALRSLIGETLNDPDLGTFAKAALTARGWYEADDQKIRGIFNSAIAAVLTGEMSSSDALEQAEDQVSQLMR